MAQTFCLFGLNAENSMRDYQPPETLAAYRNSAVFMELALEDDRSDA